ncbi:MAG: DNA polymerase/3'-5' exonuclease PolX [bacterium]
MENSEIADVFDRIADLLELQDENEFRVRSYRNAARTVRDLSHRLEDMVSEGKKLSDLPNIGKSLEGKIKEIIKTGTSKRLKELEDQVPYGLVRIMQVGGLGPRKAMLLYRELGVQSVDELKKACENQEVRNLPGMGAKTEENILKGIRTLETYTGRMLYHTAAGFVSSLVRHLESVPEVKKYEVAGSFRRRKETVGDLDILVQAKDRDRALEKILSYKEIGEVQSRGSEKSSVVLKSGLQVDFRFFDPENFGAALCYFTGSKAHNISLRKRAQDKGWKLNEYGIFEKDKLLAGRTEEDLYKQLSLKWVPPELREDRGEIEGAEGDRLPELIKLSDIRGDLHCHTKATDGSDSIQDMVEAARQKGYQYIGITDHSKMVAVARGLDDERLKKHADDIRKINAKYDDIRVLAGVEVDILKDGTLDISEEVLAELDWVVASVHFYQDMDEKKMTDRVVKAVKSGVVHSLGHPLCRIIGSRDPIKVDMDKVFEACKENRVILEINAQPDRLDLPDTYCQQALSEGLSFQIATDAHMKADLDLMDLGVGMARRGWLSKKNVINTRTAKQMEKILKKK